MFGSAALPVKPIVALAAAPPRQISKSPRAVPSSDFPKVPVKDGALRTAMAFLSERTAV